LSLVFTALSPALRTTPGISLILIKISVEQMGVVVHTYNSSTWEAEAEGLRVPGYCGGCDPVSIKIWGWDELTDRALA
jgi:hypothetical protein